MRKTLLVISLLAIVGAAFAQDEGGILGPWKRNFASASYGVAVMPFTVTGDGSNVKEEFVMPALDLRVLRGVNVTTRGGFWTGVEVGALFFFTPEDAEKKSFMDSYVGATTPLTDYEVTPEYTAAMVFVMAKYGLRLDVGLFLAGISVGADLGIGARIFNGRFEISSTINSAYGAVAWTVPDAQIDMIMDAGLEGALRIGRNFRLYARIGVLETPPVFDKPDRSGWFSNKGDIGGGASSPIDTTEEVTNLLQRYEIEFLPIIPTFNLGFIVNYE